MPWANKGFDSWPEMLVFGTTFASFSEVLFFFTSFLVWHIDFEGFCTVHNFQGKGAYF